MTRVLKAGRYELAVDRPLVMGIVNVTPDSFAGGIDDMPAAYGHALRLIDEGADILDIGGESTRPGAATVDEREELTRVLPLIERLADCGRPVSIDTRKPGVMARAVAAGAAMINDVSALRVPGAMDAAAQSDAAVCLMHMQGEPSTMQVAPQYGDVVTEVADYLRERADACIAAGIARERILVDPGFGFGKTVEHNLALLESLGRLGRLGYPVLAGLSRKGMLGKLTGRPVGERVHASVAGALAAITRGASIVRVHDVAATIDAIAVWRAAGLVPSMHDPRS
jgi:dihydropteroate synthase